jgi:probable phosphoglycerate mutase
MSDSTEKQKVKKRLYIIRHGETDLNKNGIVQGRGVDSDLNETGRAQGDAFFERYQHIAFDKLYTSKLKRTHQTVAKFIEKGLKWEQLEGLDELAWGKYEGMLSTPKLREDFKKLVEAWNLGHFDVRVEGGESPNEVYIRQASAMQHIMQQNDEHTILICMHGRAIRLLLCQLLKKSLDKMDEFPHQNTSLYILDFDGKDYSIQTFNSLDHLNKND